MESKEKVTILFEVTRSSSRAAQNQVRPGVILMVGATGNGKSTLGNFLTDPHNYRDASKSAFARHAHALLRVSAVSSVSERVEYIPHIHN
jgi:putative ribosome biogenesis GTPase RsgA